MRRSVLVRFLGLSLVVALGAVIATAVIATYSTSEQLQGEMDANTGQLQVDGQIYQRLSEYASEHPTWAGVDRLVHKLADDLGRRIALGASGNYRRAEPGQRGLRRSDDRQDERDGQGRRFGHLLFWPAAVRRNSGLGHDR
jgi:hypothetical protein